MRVHFRISTIANLTNQKLWTDSAEFWPELCDNNNNRVTYEEYINRIKKKLNETFPSVCYFGTIDKEYLAFSFKEKEDEDFFLFWNIDTGIEI
jgi:hypothetical protein